MRLEVTESLIMENPEQAIEILDWLKWLGAGIALDEFGAGYSSLSYLHRLAVDTIKIDRSLISHGSDNKSGAVVLRAALAMARELGKDVVAVGMEQEEDVAYVRALGCDYAQGFFFGEPMTEREVMNLLNALAKSNKRDEKREKKIKKPEPELLVPQAELAPPAGEPDLLDAELPPVPHVPYAPPELPQQPAPVKHSLPVPLARAKAEPLRKKGGGLFAIFGRKPAPGKVAAAKAPGFSTMLSGIFSSSKKTRAKPEKPPVPRTARMANGRDPGGLRPPRPAPQEPKPVDQQPPAHQPPSAPPAFLQQQHHTARSRRQCVRNLRRSRRKWPQQEPAGAIPRPISASATCAASARRQSWAYAPREDASFEVEEQPYCLVPAPERAQAWPASEIRKDG